MSYILVGEGIATILSKEPEFEVIGHAVNGRIAVDEAVRLQPDLILLDVHMPELDGIRTTRLICQKCPQIRCLISEGFHVIPTAD